MARELMRKYVPGVVAEPRDQADAPCRSSHTPPKAAAATYFDVRPRTNQFGLRNPFVGRRTLKMRISLICVLVFFIATDGQSESLTSSPLLGKWVADIGRLPIPVEARPKSVTITFSADDDGRLETSVEVVDASGSRMHAEGVTALDGTPAIATGNLEANASATTMPAENVLVMQLARDGVPASTRVYVVSDDEKSMVETSAYVGADGQPVLRTNYFRRAD